jgi:hypothetical protein
MKKILPIVVNPVNRCGVLARRRLMPAVDRGKVNQAQVKLSMFGVRGWIPCRIVVAWSYCLSLLLKGMLSSGLNSVVSAIFSVKLQVSTREDGGDRF